MAASGDTDWIGFAQRLADAARGETLPRFALGCAVENKASGGRFDPVTEADRAAERAMRALIEDAWPDHGIAGEEYGEKPARSGFAWSLDPVDGTRSFTCGLPSWTTLIALLEDGRPIAGVIDAPVLGERYVGDGRSSWLHGKGEPLRLTTSDCADLASCRLSTTDPFLFSGAEAEAWRRLRSSARVTRYGLDAYAYARLAAGSLDLVVENCLQPYDYEALIPVVRGAGGTVGDWRGGEDFTDGKVIAAATPQLYAAAVEIVRTAA